MIYIIENKVTKKEAVKFNGENFNECKDFIGDSYDNTLNYPNIITLEGTMRVDIGDYIIKGVEGEFYPCKPSVFKKSYNIIEMTDSFL